jgi:hypothetical protein
MLRKISLGVLSVMAILAVCGLANAALISVGNSSFETPDVSGTPYFDRFSVLTPGTPSYDAWATESPNAGVVLNGQYGRAYTNLDQAQCGWMDVGVTFLVAYQDLSNATFEVGKAYKLTIGFGRLAEGTDSNQMNVALFARDGGTNYVAGSTTVRYGDLSDTLMTNQIISVPTVRSTDPWANRSISIWLLNQGNGAGGGCWNFDNVRLESMVPEPTSMAMLAIGIIGLLAYAWRKRR